MAEGPGSFSYGKGRLEKVETPGNNTSASVYKALFML